MVSKRGGKKNVSRRINRDEDKKGRKEDKRREARLGLRKNWVVALGEGDGDGPS